MSASNASGTGLGRVFREIAARDAVSTRLLARLLRVQPSTLQNKLRELNVRGLVRFREGRSQVALHPHFGYVVGMDMGASHLDYALADFCGEVLSQATEKIRPEDGPRKMIAQIKAGIRRLARSHAERGRLQSLAVGVPSPVAPATSWVASANNLPGWRNIRLREELAREFRVPISVENDANMAALGEHWRGVAQGAGTFAVVALGTGIGCGIFVNGQLHRGRTGSAGEIHRLNVEWPRWNEDFGDTGYFESYASGQGIAARARERMSSLEPGEPSGLAEQRDARFVFEAFHRGDPRAREVLERAFTLLGVGLAGLVAVLDPDLIVLGGGAARGAPEFLLEVVRRVVSRIQPDPPPVKLSALEDKAQTLGAVFSALQAARDALGRRLGA